VQRIVKGMPDYAEFLIVIFVCFGSPIATSLWVFFLEPGFIGKSDFSNLEALELLIFEVVALATTLLFLEMRGWSLDVFRFEITWGSTLAAPLMVVGLLFTMILLQGQFGTVQGDAGAPVRVAEVSLFTAFVASVFNPIFEEVIVVAYVMNFIAARYGPIAGVAASAGIRLIYHLYQGYAAFFALLPMGILFGLIYWRWRNLWPLILAHGIWNFLPVLFSGS